MSITIHPDTTFSTGEASRMLNIDRLTPDRIRGFCQGGHVPSARNSSRGPNNGDYRIRFGDFDAILKAHDARPLMGRNRTGGPTMAHRLEALENRVQELSEQVEVLFQVLDERTAPLAGTNSPR